MKIICDTCKRVFEVKEAVTPGASFYCSESCLEKAFEEREDHPATLSGMDA